MNFPSRTGRVAICWPSDDVTSVGQDTARTSLGGCFLCTNFSLHMFSKAIECKQTPLERQQMQRDSPRIWNAKCKRHCTAEWNVILISISICILPCNQDSTSAVPLPGMPCPSAFECLFVVIAIDLAKRGWLVEAGGGSRTWGTCYLG